MTDAFGGKGGIAKFNRDLLTGLCEMPQCKEVVAVTRLMPGQPEVMPNKLNFVTKGINSKLRYIATVWDTISQGGRFDMIICGHINLLPIAFLCHIKQQTPIGLIIHGIDAWQPTKNALVNMLAKKIHFFISVSEFTKQKFIAWSGHNFSKGHILPNCVEKSKYGLGPKKPELVKQYDLSGKKVLMTCGRLDSLERSKGFDEVLEVLPELLKEVPNIAYMVVGDGGDRERLVEKAISLGIFDRTIFTGFIPETEKADYFRLADAYVMPSRGEGFGIVFLEAMACGVPVVASKIDGSREAVSDGRLGILVDPTNHEEIKSGILAALQQPRIVPEELDFFSVDNFARRLHGIINGAIQW